MNKEYWIMVGKRFLKGLLSALGAFCVLFISSLIPDLREFIAQKISDPVFLMAATAFFAAMEKALQGWSPEPQN